MPDEHALYSPSSSGRWLACPYTIPPDGAQAESRDSEASVRGTALHSRAESILHLGGDPEADLSDVLYEHPDTGKCVHLPPAEVHRHLVPYVAGVRELLANAQLGEPDALLAIEERVDITPECWGTADAVIVAPDWSLDAVDLKTGSGKIVSPDAPQFLTYGVGACHKYGWGFREIRLHRSQAPARNTWETHTTTVEELRAHEERLLDAIRVSRGGGTPTPSNINPECCWCLRIWDDGSVGMSGCPAHAQRVVQTLVEHDAAVEAGKLALPAPADIRIDKLSWLLVYGRDIIAWIEAVYAHATEQAVQGREFLGMKTVRGASKRRWKNGLDPEAIAAEVVQIAYMFEADCEPWKRELASFTEIEKHLGKQAIAHLLERPEGRLKLVPDDDPREAASALQALIDSPLED